MNRKAQMGLNTAVIFFLGLLMLAVIGVITIFILNAVTDTDLSLDDYANGTIQNESTVTVVNATGVTLVGNTSGINCVATVENVYNASSLTLIPSDNYTVTGCHIANNGDDDNYLNFVYNVTYSYTYQQYNEVRAVTQNVTDAAADNFFSDVGTWLPLLAVVIIILIVSAVIVVVKKFSSTGEASLGGEGKISEGL